ncbi:hypothetical protein AAC691_17985 [Nguyenibacter vanlangensis]|uniref:Uncharacterized protein n=1 Tax=Nguyenibacter vanlangensis TaxID=1216886 RepID=A0ABZ3D313_9PROT
MMNPERFSVLAETYGAVLARWPESERQDAQALLKMSATARGILAAQRDVDDLIARAFEEEASLFAQRAAHEDPEAAVTRLRAGVAGRIAAEATPKRGPGARFGWRLPGLVPGRVAAENGVLAVRWTAMMFGGGVVVAGGLWLGWIQAGGAPVGLFNALLVAPLGGGV